MQTDFEATYHELEEQHWWFRGRRDMLMSLIRRLNLPKDAAILDVGCSGGPLLLGLREAGYSNITGVDISKTGIDLAKSHGLPNAEVMDAADLRYGDARFELLVASDVLEHIKDDRAALRCWLRVLKPGGRLIVYVPAYQWLWSDNDEVNLHFRRYTRRTLTQALKDTGFRVDRAGYWNFALFFPVSSVRLLMRAVPRRRSGKPTGQLKRTNPLINAALFNWLKVENRIAGSGLNYPVGVSVFALARKPA